MTATALTRLRIGDRFVEAGEKLSAKELEGRNVRLLVRLGRLSVTPDRKSRAPQPNTDPDPKETPDEKPLADRPRKELDALAAELGIENPQKLPNKKALVAAIQERLDDEPETE